VAAPPVVAVAPPARSYCGYPYCGPAYVYPGYARFGWEHGYWHGQRRWGERGQLGARRTPGARLPPLSQGVRCRERTARCLPSTPSASSRASSPTTAPTTSLPCMPTARTQLRRSEERRGG